MKKLIHFAFGYMVILMLEKCVILQKKEPCTVTSDGLEADCTKRTFTEVPSNLNKEITKLDLSFARLDKMDENSFKPYKNLKILICNQTRITNPISEKYVLKPLEKLQEVHIEAVNLIDSSSFYWPKSIRILKIIGCYAKKLDLNNAEKLKILNAESNELLDIPVINPLAPIEYVNLNFNPLDEANVLSLARVCRVTHLDLSPIGRSVLLTQTSYCKCTEMLEWMKKYVTKSNVFTGDSTFTCSSLAKDTKCPDTNNEEALRKRQECLDKGKPPSSFLLLILLVVLTTIVLLLLVLFAYMYGSLRKKADMGEVVEIQHGKADASPAEETAPEEEEPSPSSDEPQKN